MPGLSSGAGGTGTRTRSSVHGRPRYAISMQCYCCIVVARIRGKISPYHAFLPSYCMFLLIIILRDVPFNPSLALVHFYLSLFHAKSFCLCLPPLSPVCPSVSTRCNSISSITSSFPVISFHSLPFLSISIQVVSAFNKNILTSFSIISSVP